MFFKHPIFTIALSMFFLMDSIGNVPIFISILKKFPPKRQRIIIFRELLIALAIMLVFYFIGDYFLSALGISDQSLRISGGIILFLISIKMIFPSKHDSDNNETQAEPFVVPLAIPLVAGPAMLAAVMIYSGQELPAFYTLSAIGIAWLFTTLILVAAPFLQKILGEKGLIALERLMGLILILIAVQMFLDGMSGFVLCHQHLQK